MKIFSVAYLAISRRDFQKEELCFSNFILIFFIQTI